MIVQYRYPCLMILAWIMLFPASSFGMRKYAGRVAHPETGAAVAGAKVHLFCAGTLDRAKMFAARHGKPIPASVVTANASGRYGFYAANGRYRIRIVSPEGKLLYDHNDVPIYDPRDPQKLFADEKHPALSLHTLGRGGEVNLPLVMEKETPDGKPIGARWRVQTHMAEVGWSLVYNYRRRGGYPDGRDLPYVDSKEEPIQTFGSNDADDGLFFMPGIMITAGGLWHPGAHNISMDPRLAMPKDDGSPVGIDMKMSAPHGLAPGDVVAVSPDGRAHVAPIAKARAKLPFVVSHVDAEKNTFVMAAGLAWVKVKGRVEPGDLLVTSEQPRFARSDNANRDPGRTLGVAVGKADRGKVLARITRVTAPKD
jgi:hypothetical protein